MNIPTTPQDALDPFVISFPGLPPFHPQAASYVSIFPLLCAFHFILYNALGIPKYIYVIFALDGHLFLREV